MKEIIDFLKEQGYRNLTEIPGRGICGLMRFAFTTGLIYGLDWEGYKGRYCFEHTVDATEALNNWDGKDDPTGNWIKHKGEIEYSNPKTQTQEQ